MADVAALFVRRDSVYKTMSCVDAFDFDRDALTFAGGMPVVAHPPCRSWGRLRQFAKARPIAVQQFHFGHRAEKDTWLYIVGCSPSSLPAIPHRPGRPTHCVRPTKSYPRLPSITKAEREHTPVALATWLVELARASAFVAARRVA